MPFDSTHSPADTLPLVVPLGSALTIEAALGRLARQPYCVCFDSALRHPLVGRYSFLAAAPFDVLRLPVGTGDALPRLAEALHRYPAETVEGLPPFQGGAAGLFAYDLARSLEALPAPRCDEFQAPALCVGFYDVVLCWDHQTDQAWIVSQGFPETEPAARQERARARAAEFQQWLTGPDPGNDSARDATASRIPAEALARQYHTEAAADLTSDFSSDDYLAAVRRTIDYIYAGDVFQVNLSQRLLHPASDDPVSLYLRLRRRNPAPFAGYFDMGDLQLCSASPERFMQVQNRRVEARPIKGTRLRTAQPEADLYRGDDLRASEKDRAENVMIVDLLRNDLSRVCTSDSVCVTQLCGLETFAYVQHLVSVIEGTLRPDCRAVDVLPAAFPGGSVTGAPKVRAMEIIAELEPTARGAYCGSLGYIGFDGSLDASILIRTITAGRGWWQLPVGGGITAQSDPQQELEETWHKAQGMLRALQP